MALTETRNQLMLLAGVRRADGDHQPTEAQAAVIDASDTIVRLRWEPGNITSYDLQYTIRVQFPVVPYTGRAPHPKAEPFQMYSLTWYRDGSGGTSIQWDQHSHLHGPWFAEKMGVNAANADGMLLFLQAVGHSVSFCMDETERQAAVNAQVNVATMMEALTDERG